MEVAEEGVVVGSKWADKIVEKAHRTRIGGILSTGPPARRSTKLGVAASELVVLPRLRAAVR